MFRARLREENGWAMITAITVSFVALLLGTVAVGLSLHNLDESALVRKKVDAIQAAEAGIDYYYSWLQTHTPTATNSGCTKSQGLTTSPSASFVATLNYYDTSGNPPTAVACPPANPDRLSVLIRSVGTAGGQTRTMESYEKITAVAGGQFASGAIFGNSVVGFTANANVYGNAYSDADIYSNGNITLSANSVIYGNVIAQGTITHGSNAEVKKTEWGGGSVTTSAASVIRGDIISSTSSVSMANATHVYGNATACTGATGGTVDGTRTTVCSANPPQRTYPTFTYSSADWVDSGYTIKEYTGTQCSTAESDLRNWFGSSNGSFLIHITGSPACTLTLASNTTYTIKGHLAIVTDGPITFNTNARFTPASGTGPWNVFLFTGLSDTEPCDFNSSPNSGMDPGLQVLLFTPQDCQIILDSNALPTGQIVGGTVTIKHAASFVYMPMVVPGVNPNQYLEDVKCLREVVTGSALPPPPAC